MWAPGNICFTFAWYASKTWLGVSSPEFIESRSSTKERPTILSTSSVCGKIKLEDNDLVLHRSFRHQLQWWFQFSSLMRKRQSNLIMCGIPIEEFISDRLFCVAVTIYGDLFRKGFITFITTIIFIAYLYVATSLSHLPDAEFLAGALSLPLLIVLVHLIHFINFLHRHKYCRKSGDSYHDSCWARSLFSKNFKESLQSLQHFKPYLPTGDFVRFGRYSGES